MTTPTRSRSLAISALAVVAAIPLVSSRALAQAPTTAAATTSSTPTSSSSTSTSTTSTSTIPVRSTSSSTATAAATSTTTGSPTSTSTTSTASTTSTTTSTTVPVPASLNEAIVPLTADAGGPLLFKLDYWLDRPTDNLIQMVGGAARLNGVVQNGNQTPKNFWASGFNSTSDEIVWTVEVSEPTEFVARLNMSSDLGDAFVLDVIDTGESLRFGAGDFPRRMDLFEPGTITIPAGRHEIRLRKSATAGFSSSVKSLELIRSSDYAAYQQRVAEFRSDTSWLTGTKGYMIQWGAWSYPRSGSKGDWQDVWNEFDVDLFVDEMVKTKVDYVAWSASWIGYMLPGPNQSVDNIMAGGSDRTAQRDLLMEIAQGLDAEGIDLVIYYHIGHSEEFSADWWSRQNWPNATFYRNAYGDRSTFFNNWKAVISEMGQHYGPLIKGFFFDDGASYYPADFEDLGAAARVGNPDRFVSYNPYLAARLTDFQDVNFGEVNCGGQVDANGTIVAGPNEGLMDQCMKRVHNHWGSYTQDWTNPGFVLTPERYVQYFDSVNPESALSLAHIMFNGPTFVDRNRDGSVGDGNANFGVAIDSLVPYVTDIEVDAQGQLFGVQDRNLYLNDANGNWQPIQAPSGDEYGMQRAGLFYVLDRGDLYRVQGSSVTPLNGKGFDIATISVGADRSVYGLTTSGDLVRWTQGWWRKMPTRMTGLTAVSVGVNANNVWFLDGKGKPFHFNGRSVSAYSRIPMTFTRIEASTNGSVFAIDTDGGLWQYRHRRWTELTSVGPVSDVSATSHDDFWFVRADNHEIGHYRAGTIDLVNSTVG